ncbi:hypothetical protein MJN76_28730, partial [Salmonella enterica subsp. enterica serovar Anatum]|nr:hypothetical protein [Salmonella enterica subsp. enterica serovar Anatum]
MKLEQQLRQLSFSGLAAALLLMVVPQQAFAMHIMEGCLINGNRQGMLQGDSIGTKAAQLFVFDLLYTLLVQSSPEQAR